MFVMGVVRLNSQVLHRTCCFIIALCTLNAVHLLGCHFRGSGRYHGNRFLVIMVRFKQNLKYFAFGAVTVPFQKSIC